VTFRRRSTTKATTSTGTRQTIAILTAPQSSATTPSRQPRSNSANPAPTPLLARSVWGATPVLRLLSAAFFHSPGSVPSSSQHKSVQPAPTANFVAPRRLARIVAPARLSPSPSLPLDERGCRQRYSNWWPLVPLPVWSTVYLILQKVTSPRFIILNGGFRPRRYWRRYAGWGSRERHARRRLRLRQRYAERR
jgi:hypothetical protein